MGVISMKLTSYHPPGAYSFEVVPKYFENLCTPDVYTLYFGIYEYACKDCTYCMNKGKKNHLLYVLIHRFVYNGAVMYA